MRFFFYSNLYIACCAAVCMAGTLHLTGSSPVKWSLPVFAASSVIIIYNLHYFYNRSAAASGRKPWFYQNALPVHIITLLAVAACMASALQLNGAQWLTATVIGLLALAYSLPVLPGGKSINQYGLPKIITLSLCWTAFTTWLPVAGSVSLSDKGWWLLLAERALFFFILCLLLDIRDRPADAGRGIRTLAVRLGDVRAHRLAYLLTAVLALLNMGHAFMEHSPAVFHAFALTTLLTGFTAWLCHKRPQPWLWLAGIDGLLLVHGVLLAVV